MSKLINVAPGTWIDPNAVESVIAFTGDEKLKISPRTSMTMKNREGISWEFDTVDKAVSLADKIAGILNETENKE
jgi:hypothetical protein